ncbi:hypothetical protein Y1Q_0003803 [Alligator mississippiensis]|uniref:Uncharacterized protein n=1 Tax=Alligator mississippiensis TaxID=8496 RepID=A0A151MNP4_ALLMI|nr:hypothetical protein Y1Q_0003803 [Alligator mississippiensis]
MEYSPQMVRSYKRIGEQDGPVLATAAPASTSEKIQDSGVEALSIAAQSTKKGGKPFRAIFSSKTSDIVNDVIIQQICFHCW